MNKNKHVLKHKDFNTRYLVPIKYISVSKESFKLFLNIRIILSFYEIQLVQIEEQTEI